MSSSPPPLELRAQRWWHAPALLVGAGAFVLAGAALVVAGAGAGLAGIAMIAFGALAVVFFGGVLVTGLPDVLRGRSLRLDARGVVIRRGGETLELAWSEITDVGVVTIHRTHLVGLRLQDPQAAARQAPAAATGGGVNARRLVAACGAIVRQLLPGAIPGDPGSVAPADGTLRYNRATTGYDVCLGWMDRDRSARKLVELIEQYRGASPRAPG
jgi:hypothetical protein